MTRTTTPLQELMQTLIAPMACRCATTLEEAMKNPGCVCEVDEETYDFYLDALPPHFIDGHVFCFAEGLAPYTLFWRTTEHFFARQLTQAQTLHLARLAGIPEPGCW